MDDVFVLLNKALFQKKDGNNFLNVTLSDKTGNLKGVMWDQVDQVLATGLSSGDFVQIMGNVNEYRGDRQLVIKKMTACPPDSIDSSDFLPKTHHNIESMLNRLVEFTAAMQKEHLQSGPIHTLGIEGENIMVRILAGLRIFHKRLHSLLGTTKMTILPAMTTAKMPARLILPITT